MGIFKLIKNIFKRSKSGSNPQIVIGIPGIDAQHHEFFQKCDAILDYLRKDSASANVVSKFFNEVIELLKNHFFTEENLFEIIGFPRAEEHKAEHANFMDQILRQEAILNNSENAETVYFINTFREAFLSHIVVFDKPYTNHIEKLVALGKKFKITTLKAQTLTK